MFMEKKNEKEEPKTKSYQKKVIKLILSVIH